MVKRIRNPDWKRLVLEWHASGKCAKSWCEENKISYNTLMGWKKRLKKFDLSNISVKSEIGFIELKNHESFDSGITLECVGIKIHLNTQFDPSALKKCLNCLRGA